MIVWIVIGVAEEVVLWIMMWRMWKECKRPKEERAERAEEEMKEVIRRERKKNGYKIYK